MTREYVVKVTDAFVPDAFQRFESEWSPEQEIVRCVDCKHFHSEVKDEFTTFFGCSERHDTWGKYWFCPDGERKE